MIYAFDDYTLDTGRCALRRGGTEIALRPKSFDLLRYLVERAGRVAGKDEILGAVWPDVTVEEASLTQSVALLRKALGTEGERLIRTVPRRGYVFEGEVTRAPRPRRQGQGRLLPLAAAAALGAVAVPAAELVSGWMFPGPAALLNTSTTVLGQPIDYPDGAARLVATVKTLPPEGVSPWHSHDRPTIGYVIEGAIETDYGDEGRRRFSSGEALVEALDVAHAVRNPGMRTARILVLELKDATDPL